VELTDGQAAPLRRDSQVAARALIGTRRRELPHLRFAANLCVSPNMVQIEPLGRTCSKEFVMTPKLQGLRELTEKEIQQVSGGKITAVNGGGHTPGGNANGVPRENPAGNEPPGWN
jgi:hypothetical protein